LLTSAPDPIFAIDSEGKITFVNEEGLRVLNREQEQILGQPFADLVPGVGLRHIGVGPVESFLPGPDIHIAERVYSPSVRVLPSDNAASTTVALRDVTDRRRLESRRLDFYSVIAHDLRTPITSILLRLEMAFRGKHGVLPASHMGDLRKTETSLRSLMGMINDFLELARLEGVGYKIERNPVDLNKLVTSTVEDFVPLLEKNGLRWKHSGLEENVTVLADRQRLAQVMANLVGNAIKFTPGPGEVTTTLRATSFDVEFSVSDTGPGIPSEEIDGLFERYARSSNVARGAMGTGLGLMIVREIVEAHGGTVGAESLLGKGSRFWFRLPRTETESKA
jgi:two-component system phosphate regulon sensor histidine kinase PhoR